MQKSRHGIVYTLCYVAVVCGQLTKSPENVAGLVGSDVTLRCAGTDLIWEEFVSNPTGHAVAISSGDRVAKPNKYGLITEPTGTFDLTIKSIELKQGGRYNCKAFLDSTSFTYAQVITFSGETLLLFLP